MKLAPVNITNCDKEPIHLIDLIQSFGYQFVYSAAGKLVNYSKNFTALFKKDDLPQEITKLIPAEQAQQLRTIPQHVVLHDITIGEKLFSVRAYRGDASFVVELEPLTTPGNGDYQIINRFIQQLEQATDIPTASLHLAETIQKLLDYDRIMIYAFDDEWNGYVVNEVVKPGIHSYFNHHFPSSDIPMQAREMLLKVRTRQIADVNATPVELSAPVESVTFELSAIRQPSEIHLQFLRNMHVHATLTFSIVVNGRLWGLVCGQHESPVYKDSRLRTLCQNIASIFAHRVPHLDEKKDEARIKEAHIAIDNFYVAGIKHESLLSAIRAHHPFIQQLVSATGIVVVTDESILTGGIVPAGEQILELLHAIKTSDEITYIHRVTAYLPSFKADASVVSGVLYLQVSEELKLLWFRPEVQLTRTWAGNPEKDVIYTSKGIQINPRKSFEAYVEKVKNTSRKWSVTDVAIIRLLKKTLDDLQLKLLFNDAISSRNALKGKIDKLSEISTIIAHDLKNPITNLQLLISLFESEDEADIPWLVSQLKNISQSLMDNVNNLSNLTELLAQQAVPKNQLVFEEVLLKSKKQLEGQIISSSANIETDFQVEKINYPTVYLESIFANLLSNAIKYRMPDRTPHIKVKTSHAGDYVKLEVQDNGRGLELNGKGINTFGLFKTFHNHPQARGIGIYITRSQVESLGGKMEAQSTVGEGTHFIIHLKNFTDA